MKPYLIEIEHHTYTTEVIDENSEEHLDYCVGGTKRLIPNCTIKKGWFGTYSVQIKGQDYKEILYPNIIMRVVYR